MAIPKLPTKVNPGCKIPDIPAIPNIEEYLNVQLPQKAIERLIPPLPSVRLQDLQSTITAEVEAYTSAVNRRARTLRKLLSIPCPLPRVPDNGIDLYIPGVHDLVDLQDGQSTLGESLFIEEDEFLP